LVLPMFWSGDALSADHLVALPVFESASDVKASIVLPEFHRFAEVGIWKLGITLAIVASIETLLSVEAVDRLDPHKRISPPNRELMAQGTANLLSGFIGGLPVTAVIVRSSANVVAGGQTRLSALFHGLLLLAGVLFFGSILNTIPLAALAVVLIAVGLKLTNRKLWVSMWKAGAIQFAPFAITVLAVVFTDLLTGTMIGLAAGVILMLREQRKNSVFVTMEDDKYVVRATKDLTFLQKAQVKEILGDIPDGATVHIDRSGADFVDPDVEELFEDFEQHCRDSGIQLEWTRREASDEAPPTDAARSEVAA
jgi:MFS superfamily sulfate permease-like transporter